ADKRIVQLLAGIDHTGLSVNPGEVNFIKLSLCNSSALDQTLVSFFVSTQLLQISFGRLQIRFQSRKLNSSQQLSFGNVLSFVRKQTNDLAGCLGDYRQFAKRSKISRSGKRSAKAFFLNRSNLNGNCGIHRPRKFNLRLHLSLIVAQGKRCPRDSPKSN